MPVALAVTGGHAGEHERRQSQETATAGHGIECAGHESRTEQEDDDRWIIQHVSAGSGIKQNYKVGLVGHCANHQQMARRGGAAMAPTGQSGWP